jgi:dephospho-CoA kinase
MDKPVIGLLGGIGAGKSFVAGLLAERGGFLIAADPLAHEALRQPEVRDQVVAIFGRECLGPDGEVIRVKLAGPVFADAALRQKLEALVFPWVGAKVAGLIEQAQADPAVEFIVLDAPVMLEAGWNNVADRLVYVDVPRDVQLARLAQRGWTAEQLAARENAQMPAAEKARRADAVIDNGGPPDATARQVDALLAQWKLL